MPVLMPLPMYLWSKMLGQQGTAPAPMPLVMMDQVRRYQQQKLGEFANKGLEKVVPAAEASERKVYQGNLPEPYVVKSGDSLWKIAKEQLGDGSLWGKIAQMNGIQNPGLIKPGQRLNLPGQVSQGELKEGTLTPDEMQIPTRWEETQAPEQPEYRAAGPNFSVKELNEAMSNWSLGKTYESFKNKVNEAAEEGNPVAEWVLKNIKR